MTKLINTDKNVAKLIELERLRQEESLILIASENYASKSILEAQASEFINKYAEGYPHKRYYGGCEIADQIEELAIKRAKKLFGADHANVQAHSGSQANMACYFASIKPGDTILGPRLDQGGHLTHGSPVNFSGILYNIISYGVTKNTETIDYDQVKQLAHKYRPKIILAGFTAYSRKIDYAKFREICDEINAILLCDIAHIAGLIAAKIHQSPIPYADLISSTTQKTLRGPRGGLILSKEKWAKKIDRGIFPKTQGGPFINVIAAKAVCFQEASTDSFKEYQKKVVKNAKTLGEILEENGLRIVSGGTDTHMILVDLTSFKITGQEAETILSSVNISANKNTIPYDPLPPRIASGLRLGTPAITTRGFKENEMQILGELIATVLKNPSNSKIQTLAKNKVLKLAQKFPTPYKNNN
tara:strand:+ start:3761 stop:5008 length:1248 start_codon:yes stop_codon:yes gene_type:complete